MARGEEFQAITDRAAGDRSPNPEGEGRGNQLCQWFCRIPTLREGSQEKGGGGKAAKGVKVVQGEGGDGGHSDEAGMDFKNVEFGGGFADFAGED